MSSSDEHRQDRSETPGLGLDHNAPVVSGAHRKSGVIWTTEARNDMFQRRENNESWESICRDYPARSRHAMQQQYSMMKKQKMMAEGTWTNNRRGRKRKQPLPGLVAGLQRRESGLDDTEGDMSVTPSDFEVDDGEDMAVDDLDVGTPGPEIQGPAIGGVQGVLDFNRPPTITGRPSPLSRSATDPAPVPPPPSSRGRGGGRGRGRIPSAYGAPDNGPPPLAPKSFTPINAVEPSVVKPAKRALNESNSLSPAHKRVKPLHDVPPAEEEPTEPEIPPPFSHPMVLFTQEQLTDFFRVGVQAAEQAKKHLDNEHAARDQATHDHVVRVNRRVREAEDRLKENTYRHRTDIRTQEEIQKEQLRAVQQERDETVRDLETRLIMARSKIPATADGSTVNGSQDGPLQGSEGVTSPELLALVGALEDLKPRYESELERRKKAEGRIAALEQQLRNQSRAPPASPETLAQLDQLNMLLKNIQNDAPDLGPRALIQRLTEANSQCSRLANSLLDVSQPLPALQPPSFAASPQLPGPLPVIQAHQVHAPNASLTPHSAHRPLPPSASPSPVPDRHAFGPSPTSQPMLASSEVAHGSPSFTEQKRTQPSLRDIMNQEPPHSSNTHKTLPPMHLGPRPSSPQSRQSHSPLPAPPHTLPSVPSPVPGSE